MATEHLIGLERQKSGASRAVQARRLFFRSVQVSECGECGCRSNRRCMAGYPGLGPPAGMPRPAAGVSRRAHDAISEKQDGVAWNATTDTLTVSWKR